INLIAKVIWGIRVRDKISSEIVTAKQGPSLWVYAIPSADLRVFDHWLLPAKCPSRFILCG
ncbi:MAG: hypothetical protein ACPHL6_04530, partial [Rubripirellula sp.]